MKIFLSTCTYGEKLIFSPGLLAPMRSSLQNDANFLQERMLKFTSGPGTQELEAPKFSSVETVISFL